MDQQPSGLDIESMSSIETEPRTLTFDQLQYAREAALLVLKTRSLEESISIFTEGLQPVDCVRRTVNFSQDVSESDYLVIDHTSTQLTGDIVSAPF